MVPDSVTKNHLLRFSVTFECLPFVNLLVSLGFRKPQGIPDVRIQKARRCWMKLERRLVFHPKPGDIRRRDLKMILQV